MTVNASEFVNNDSERAGGAFESNGDGSVSNFGTGDDGIDDDDGTSTNTRRPR